MREQGKSSRAVQLGGGLAIELANPEAPLFRIFGTRRSGNHAIVQWLKNGVDHKLHLHFDQARIGCHPAHGGSCQVGDLRFRPRKGMTVNERETYTDALINADFVTIFYEEQDLGPSLGRFVRISGDLDRLPSKNVIVVRDLINWLASIRKHPSALGGIESSKINQTATIVSAMVYWKVTAKRALGLFDDIPHLDFVPIFFDEWVLSDEYRQTTATKLGLATDRVDVPKSVLSYGGGSSFSKMDGVPDPRELSQRWRTYVGDDMFELLLRIGLQDEELRNILEHSFRNTFGLIEEHFPNALPSTSRALAGPDGIV